MVTIVPKFIETQGAELVLLTRAEFDHLMAIAEDAEENAADIALYDARKAALDADAHPMLPPEVSDIFFQFGTIWPIAVSVGKSAIEIGTRIDKASTFAKRDNFFKRNSQRSFHEAPHVKDGNFIMIEAYHKIEYLSCFKLHLS